MADAPEIDREFIIRKLREMRRKSGVKEKPVPSAPDENGPPTPYRMEMQDPTTWLYAMRLARARKGSGLA